MTNNISVTVPIGVKLTSKLYKAITQAIKNKVELLDCGIIIKY